MRVLWFTNGPMPAVYRRLQRPAGGSGHWMSSLLDLLRGVPGLRLGVAVAHPGLPDDHFEEGGVDYFVFSQPRFQSIFNCAARDLDRCCAMVREWNPDLIHVHGSERFYGLLGARGRIAVPVAISLQGFHEPCRSAFFGALSLKDVLRTQRFAELATGRGLLWRYAELRAAIRQEREILAGCRFFLGRTEWDREMARRHNPQARYFHVGELLRSAFSDARWDLSACDRHTVIFTHAGEPRRGTEVLLEALSLLLREFPDARLRLAGELGSRRGYDRFLRRTIAERGLSGNVDCLGYLDAAAMAKELSRAHVFAIASYTENSSNSLCEAMRVGMPCVASFTGGIPSLVEHTRTGLLFPPGDAALLADSVRRIFREDDLAVSLARRAREVAGERHDPATIVDSVLEAYHGILGLDSRSSLRPVVGATGLCHTPRP